MVKNQARVRSVAVGRWMPSRAHYQRVRGVAVRRWMPSRAHYQRVRGVAVGRWMPWWRAHDERAARPV